MKTSRYISVNYGINLRGLGRHFTHECGKMRIKGKWKDPETQAKIKKIIQRRHPGWNVTGWALAK